MDLERTKRVGAMLDAKAAAVAAEKREADARRTAAARPANTSELSDAIAYPVLCEYETLLRKHGWRAFADGDPPKLCVKRPDDREASIQFTFERDAQTIHVSHRLSSCSECPVPLEQFTSEKVEQLVERFLRAFAE